MLYANVDGRKVEASLDGPRRGTCPGCDSEVIAKTGECQWHFEHVDLAARLLAPDPDR